MNDDDDDPVRLRNGLRGRTKFAYRPADVRRDKDDSRYCRKPLHHRGLIACPSNADYSDEERVFMMAAEAYKRRLGVVMLDPKQILELAKELGYSKE